MDKPDQARAYPNNRRTEDWHDHYHSYGKFNVVFSNELRQHIADGGEVAVKIYVNENENDGSKNIGIKLEKPYVKDRVPAGVSASSDDIDF